MQPGGLPAPLQQPVTHRQAIELANLGVVGGEPGGNGERPSPRRIAPRGPAIDLGAKRRHLGLLGSRRPGEREQPLAPGTPLKEPLFGFATEHLLGEHRRAIGGNRFHRPQLAQHLNQRSVSRHRSGQIVRSPREARGRAVPRAGRSADNRFQFKHHVVTHTGAVQVPGRRQSSHPSPHNHHVDVVPRLRTAGGPSGIAQAVTHGRRLPQQFPGRQGPTRRAAPREPRRGSQQQRNQFPSPHVHRLSPRTPLFVVVPHERLVVQLIDLHWHSLQIARQHEQLPQHIVIQKPQ